MILEQALGDENEYNRLDKIRIGCKYISQQMPFMTTFNDSQTIKYLICCYPFSPTNVELLVSAFFDRFKDLCFFNSFFKAINEISQYPEQKVLLSNLRSQRQQSRRSLLKNSGKETIQFAKQAIENLLIVKQFSSRYLYQLFQLGQFLEIDLEDYTRIFMKYLQNTKDERFITEIIDIFQSIKHDIFKNSLWSINLEDQIEQYFYTVQHPSTFTRLDTIQDNTSSDEDISEIDMHEVIEKWLCQDEQCFIKEQIEYFRNDGYFEFMMKFIFDPQHSQPISEWKTIMNTEVNDLIDDFRSWKSELLKLENIYLVRSRKILKVITFDKNYAVISKQVPQLLMKLFYFIYEAVADIERAVNLQHIGYLVDYLLTQSPKSCLYYIVDLNLIFSFSQYLHNTYFQHIFEKLFNSIDDEYQLGMHVSDQFWLYVQSTNFFDYLTLVMTNQKIDRQKIDRVYKTDQACHVIPLLKAQTNFDRLPKIQEQNLNEKKFLTDLLGQITPGKSPNEFYGMSQNNWHLYDDIQENIKMDEFNFKDLDNLKEFAKQRIQSHNKFQRSYNEQKFKKQRTIIFNQHTPLSPQPKILSGPKLSALDIAKFESKTTTAVSHVSQPRLSSASKQNKWINVNAQKNYLRQGTQQKQQLLMNTSVRLRTFGSDKSDFSSNDGFSSSKLRTIYPSVKMKQETNFEKSLQSLERKEHLAAPCATVIKSVIQTAFHYCWRKIHSLGLYKQQYKLNMDLIFCSIITKDCLERLFQVYLSYLHCSNDGEISSADECGIAINEIYSNYPRIKQQNKIVDQLKECFVGIADYLCKTIVKVNKQQHKMDHQQLNYKQFLLTDTLLYGLQMFESSKSQNPAKNPYLYLNETVLHILIIWFFDAIQYNIQQGQFVNLFILIMTRAPQHIILSLTFKLGFITSLYNFQSKYSKNGMMVTTGVESFYLHLTFIIHIINETIKNRNLQVISVSLNQLQSWQSLLTILPNPTSKAVLILNQRMKCTTIYVPTKVIVNQFHSLKSMEVDHALFQPKMILDSIKQKLHVPQVIQEQQNKGVKFLNCVKEKVGQNKKLENLFKGK